MAGAGGDPFARRDGDDRAEGTPFAACVVTTTGCVDVSITGEVDLTTRDALMGVLDTACSVERHVRLDLSGLAFLDPQGALLLGRRQADHPRFDITAASDAVRRIIEILGGIEGIGAVPRLVDSTTYDSVQ